MDSHIYISYVITRADSIAKSKTGFFLELSNNWQADGSSIQLTERIKRVFFRSPLSLTFMPCTIPLIVVVNVHEFSTTGTDIACLFVEKISRQKTD